MDNTESYEQIQTTYSHTHTANVKPKQLHIQSKRTNTVSNVDTVWMLYDRGLTMNKLIWTFDVV